MESTWKTAVCTISKGDFHYGLGALANSLYRRGFRGVVWAGIGNETPPWAKPLRESDGYSEFAVGEGCVIRFVEDKTTFDQVVFNKPAFMLDVWERHQPGAEAMFFFDSDIVVTKDWGYFEAWVSHGIALCEDMMSMPSTHPIRLEMVEFAKEKGHECARIHDHYLNSGFVGIRKEHIGFLRLWQDFYEDRVRSGSMRHTMRAKHSEARLAEMMDQDCLNVAAMATTHPLSIIGPEGMDFVPSCFAYYEAAMSHAVLQPKPWRKNIVLESLNSRAPSRTDILFWEHADKPIRMYPPRRLAMAGAQIFTAKILAKLARRRICSYPR